jgi:hypothetical protein
VVRSETFLVVAGVAVVGVLALIAGFLARRRGARSFDAGSVSARWLAQSKWEREE